MRYALEHVWDHVFAGGGWGAAWGLKARSCGRASRTRTRSSPTTSDSSQSSSSCSCSSRRCAAASPHRRPDSPRRPVSSSGSATRDSSPWELHPRCSGSHLPRVCSTPRWPVPLSEPRGVCATAVLATRGRRTAHPDARPSASNACCDRNRAGVEDRGCLGSPRTGLTPLQQPPWRYSEISAGHVPSSADQARPQVAQRPRAVCRDVTTYDTSSAPSSQHASTPRPTTPPRTTRRTSSAAGRRPSTSSGARSAARPTARAASATGTSRRR